MLLFNAFLSQVYVKLNDHKKDQFTSMEVLAHPCARLTGLLSTPADIVRAHVCKVTFTYISPTLSNTLIAGKGDPLIIFEMPMQNFATLGQLLL
jgi:hypothetical protein